MPTVVGAKVFKANSVDQIEAHLSNNTASHVRSWGGDTIVRAKYSLCAKNGGVASRARGCEPSNCNFPWRGTLTIKKSGNVERFCFPSGWTEQINSAQQQRGIKSTRSNWSVCLSGTLSGKQTERRGNFHLIRELPTGIGRYVFFPSEGRQSRHPGVRTEQIPSSSGTGEKFSVEEERRRWMESVKCEGVRSVRSITVSWKSGNSDS